MALKQVAEDHDQCHDKTLQDVKDVAQQVRDELQNSHDADVELLQQVRDAAIDLRIGLGVSTAAGLLVVVQLANDFSDNTGNGMINDTIEDTDQTMTRVGGIVDKGNNLIDEGVGAVILLAVIEFAKDDLDLNIQVDDDSVDIVVVTASDESGGGDGDGQGHSTTGEDRENIGEAHFD